MENFTGLSQLHTPCYIFDEQVFSENILSFFRVLNEYFERSIIGYSFKTNSLPRLLFLANKLGCYAEVVSDEEYLLAKEIGFDSDKIIFNGPVKGKAVFLDAIENGSLVNIDSYREVRWLSELELDKSINIGIRVNIDLEHYLPGHTSTGELGGRFGFSYENGSLHRLIQEIKQLSNINIDRLHMHISNATKSVEVYKCLAKLACEIIDKESVVPSYIDLGGGYFGGGDNGEQYKKYISGIFEVLKEKGKNTIGIIVEPGASIVATAFSYLTRVVDKKDTPYGRFVVTDGTRLHIDPFFNKNKYVYELYYENSKMSVPQTICGYTCMEKDRIMSIVDNELEIDDMILYDIVGSYTLCFNPLFISYLPCVYSKQSDRDYVVVREAWGVEEYLQKNRWDL